MATAFGRPFYLLFAQFQFHSLLDIGVMEQSRVGGRDS